MTTTTSMAMRLRSLMLTMTALSTETTSTKKQSMTMTHCFCSTSPVVASRSQRTDSQARSDGRETKQEKNNNKNIVKTPQSSNKARSLASAPARLLRTNRRVRRHFQLQAQATSSCLRSKHRLQIICTVQMNCVSVSEFWQIFWYFFFQKFKTYTFQQFCVCIINLFNYIILLFFEITYKTSFD